MIPYIGGLLRGYGRGKGTDKETKEKEAKGHGKGYGGSSRGKSHRGETSIAREQEHSGKGWQEHPQGYKVQGKHKNKSKLAWNMSYIMRNNKQQPFVIPFDVCNVHASTLSVTRLAEQGCNIKTKRASNNHARVRVRRTTETEGGGSVS